MYVMFSLGFSVVQFLACGFQSPFKKLISYAKCFHFMTVVRPLQLLGTPLPHKAS